MISIVTGRTGSGKTTFAIIQIVKELVFGTRVIVTNVALRLDKLADYIRLTYKLEIDGDRVVQLDIKDDRLKFYWRIRSKDRELGEFGGADWQNPGPGVFFVIDEIQSAFSAREWGKHSGECGQYGAQQRKLGDDSICISPHPALIDKLFRILSNECVILDNWYHRRVRWFRAPRKIVWHAYTNCPPQVGEEPVATGHFLIDPDGVSGCFDTAAGAGLIGQTADIGKVEKGISVTAILPAVLVCGVLVFVGIRWLSHRALEKGRHVVGSQLSGVGDYMRGVAGPVLARPSESGPGTNGGFSAFRSVPAGDGSLMRGFSALRVCSSWGESGGRYIVVMSDGSIEEGPSPVRFWSRGIVVGGEQIVLRHVGVVVSKAQNSGQSAVFAPLTVIPAKRSTMGLGAIGGP